MIFKNINKQKIICAIISGLMLTCSFPKISMPYFAWFALIPVLFAIRDLSVKNSFYIGFIAGLVHFFTLLYWLISTMRIYGYLPIYLCVPILILLCCYLALYMGSFSAILSKFSQKPGILMFIIPVSWVCLEYIRTYFLSGFPWGLVGYSQSEQLNLIQISDIFGVFGVSFLVVFCNAAFFVVCLDISKKRWQGQLVSKKAVRLSVLFFSLIFSGTWFYGQQQIKYFDKLISGSSHLNAAIIQGNIEQDKKWSTQFQKSTTQKYVALSKKLIKDQPELIVWPETATPFYYEHNTELTEIVKKGIKETGASFLIGSPSFSVVKDNIHYFNSAYLINSHGKVSGKYDKVHLVPFGEYVPFKKWVPFLGKIVAHSGDFVSGNRGKTLELNKSQIGMQICFEIIFPNLSRYMTENNANILVNITNDAWFGFSGAPFQNFSMAVFRAVENKRSLVRSANTGISGFVDPVGRIIATTPLFEDFTINRSLPLIDNKTIYTQFGDIFAIICLVSTLFIILRHFFITMKKM